MSDGPQAPLSNDEARRRRLEALSSLAQQGQSAKQEPVRSPSPQASANTPAVVRPPRTSLAPPRSARRQPLLVIGGVLLAIIVIAGIVLHQINTAPQQPAAPVSIAPSLGAQTCIRDIAWSPDGKQIAVLGYRDQCGIDFPSGYEYHPGVIHIYDAATGQLVHTILPDDAIAATPGFPAPGPVTRQGTGPNVNKTVIDYGALAWSPNGKQLAISFFVNRWKDTNGDELPGVTGIALMNPDGTNERAILSQQTSVTDYTPLGVNVTSGKSFLLPPNPQSGLYFSLAPGMSYTWSAGGTLTPNGSLTGATAPNTPVGNPDGGTSFTIWQPGAIVLQTVGFVNNQTVTVSPGAYTWGSAFLAWSPDGEYLISEVTSRGLVQPAGKPAPTADGLKALMFDQAPTIAIRDAAMQQVALSLQPDASNNREPAVDLAWRPDGRYLAALPEQNSNGGNGSNGGNASAPITLYATANGTIVEHLQPLANAQIGANDFIQTNNVLRWSPDGSHLLCYSSVLGTITIWGPDLLPR